MRRKSIHFVLAAIVGCFAPWFAIDAGAHHSAAMFDDQQVLTFKGTVERFDYLNPHSWLYVNVENDDGSITEWGFELDSPVRLRRIGVSPTFWRAGDQIVVKTNPLRDGRPAGHLVGALAPQDRTFGDVTGISL